MIRFLQQDNKATKTIFAVFIGAAIVAMVITLVPGIFDNVGGGNDSTNYATVKTPGYFGRLFGESVPVTQVEVTRQAQQQLQQQKLPAFLLPYMMNRAGQALIQQAILKIEGDRRGLQVTDADLVRELHEGQIGQVLFPNGQYIGDEAYMNFVQNQLNMTRAEFESLVKRDMELGRLQSLITGGATVSDADVKKAYLVSGTKVKFDYAVVSADALAKTLNPTDAELETYFKQNQARYANAIPETRKIEYVSFGVDQLPGGRPQVTDAGVQQYYNQHIAEYQVKEQAKARHILIAVPDGASAQVDAAAKAKAEKILAQLKAGGDFAKLAEENSDDPGSKTQGGELGEMQRGQTVPEFDKVLFTLTPGQTSGVIKTKFGYHIIQVESRDTAHTKPLSEVKAEIVPILEQQQVGAAEQKFANDLAAQAKKDGIEKAAAAHGLHAVTTEYLAKDGTVAGVSDGAAMLSQAFGMSKGAAPAVVSTGDGFAVFQVTDVKAAHAPTFADWKSHVLQDYRDQQVPQMVMAQLNRLDERAKALGDLKKAAAELNVAVKTSDLVGKDGQVAELGAMSGAGSVAFDLAKGAVSGPINTGKDGVVLQVTDKQQPDAAEIVKNLDATREKMLNDRRSEIFNIYLSTLMEKYQKAGAIRVSKQAQQQPGLPTS